MNTSRRRFKILSEIAEGGFGKVYLAEQMSQEGFSRVVAVKLLHAKWSSHDEIVKRTRDEARLLGRIRHQHIVRVEDLTTIDGKCALVMEYLEGVDLKGLATFLKAQGRRLPRAVLFESASAVASALDAAFNGTPLQGGAPLKVIHRDIKPSNIFLTVQGGVKVLDFGTARASFAEREAKTQALAFGSQGYMAPERMLGEEDTPAADVFSLGVTLSELILGESFGRIPPRPNKLANKVDEVLDALDLDGPPGWADRVRALLRSMLAFDPFERPTPATLVDAFDALATEATDEPLKRFCRTAVAEAKAAQPKSETDDPLISRLVEEDPSSSFSAHTGPVSRASGVTPTSELPGVTPAPSGDSSGAFPEHPEPTWDEANATQPGGAPLVASARSGPSEANTASRPIPPPALTDLEIDDRAEGGVRGGNSWVWFAGIAVGVVVVILLGIGVVGAFLVSREVAESPPVASGGEVAPSPSGGAILTPDSRSDVATTPTLLRFSDAAGATVEIKNGTGFSARWDGRADFDLGPLAAGRYGTVITLPGGSKVRGKFFSVEAGKPACTFVFDTGTREWSGGCP